MRAASSRSIGDLTYLSVREQKTAFFNRRFENVMRSITQSNKESRIHLPLRFPFFVVFDYRGIPKGGRGPSFDPYTLHKFQACYAAILLPSQHQLFPLIRSLRSSL